jgi:hypothetical protein
MGNYGRGCGRSIGVGVGAESVVGAQRRTVASGGACAWRRTGTTEGPGGGGGHH